MADRRMISKQIIDSDAFLDMPVTTQCLYFHLLIEADDDGFINKVKSVQKQLSATDDDLKLLFANGLLIPFPDGIVVIKHWRVHNYIPKDRYKETVYHEDKSYLTLEKNGEYSPSDAYWNQNGDNLYTNCIQPVYKMDTQVRLDKDRLDKISIDKDNGNPKHKYGEYKNVLLTDEEYEKWKSECNEAEAFIERLSEYMASTGKHYKNHLATLRNWYRREKPKEEPAQKASYDLDKWISGGLKGPIYKG